MIAASDEFVGTSKNFTLNVIAKPPLNLSHRVVRFRVGEPNEVRIINRSDLECEIERNDLGIDFSGGRIIYDGRYVKEGKYTLRITVRDKYGEVDSDVEIEFYRESYNETNYTFLFLISCLIPLTILVISLLRKIHK